MTTLRHLATCAALAAALPVLAKRLGRFEGASSRLELSHGL